MKQFLITSILLASFFSCTEKKAQTDSSSTEISSDAIAQPLEGENKESDEEQANKFLCSQELQGIWGQFGYLEKLKETNSITLANKYAFETPGIDLKIGSSESVIDHISFMEPQYLSDSEYGLGKISEDSLYLLDKESDEKTLFLKVRELPPNTNSVWGMSGPEYSIIDLMKWEWFSGDYKYIDVVNNTEKIVRFTKDGFYIDGDKKIPYGAHSFLVYGNFDNPDPTTTHDYLFFKDEDNNYRYSIIEYEDGVFSCYGVEDFEDWEEPFVKTHLEYKLVKQS